MSTIGPMGGEKLVTPVPVKSGVICVVGYPRSGSTLFMQLLNSVSPIRSYYEIFHKDEQVAIDSMGGRWAEASQALAERGIEPNLVELKRRPMQLLRVLQELSGGATIAFKTFPQHLPRPALAGLLPKTVPVFLFRNLLDSYISQQIALSLGRWGGIATSEVKVEFEEEAFVRYALFTSRFLRFALTKCFEQNQPFLWYDYVQFSREGFADKLAGDLAEALPSVDFKLTAKLPAIRRQDVRPSPLSKLSNPSLAERFILSERLDSLLDSDLRSDFPSLVGRLELVAQRHGWHAPKPKSAVGAAG